MEMSSSGIARARPERRVTIPTPFKAFKPPPMQITTRKGAMRSGIKETIETFVASVTAGIPVIEAIVVVGIPMEPKDGATAFEIRQATIVRIGG